MNPKKKIKFIITSLILVFSLITLPISSFAASVTVKGRRVEEVTNEIYNRYEWELAKKDVNSEKETTEAYFSQTVKARNANEAIRKVTGNLSCSCVGVSASAQGEAGKTSSGEILYEFFVSGKKIIEKIQYYDLYKQYKYSYYVVIVRNGIDGPIVGKEYEGVFKGKYATGKTETRPGRYTHP